MPKTKRNHKRRKIPASTKELDQQYDSIMADDDGSDSQDEELFSIPAPFATSEMKKKRKQPEKENDQSPSKSSVASTNSTASSDKSSGSDSDKGSPPQTPYNYNNATSCNSSTTKNKASMPMPIPKPEVMSSAQKAALEGRAKKRVLAGAKHLDWAKLAHYNINELKWHQQTTKKKSSKKKEKLLYPCRICDPEEAVGLDLQKRGSETVLVQYICCPYASDRHYVTPRQLFALVVDPETKAIPPETMDTYMNTSRDTILTHKKFKDKDKALELVVQRMDLERVVRKCLEKAGESSGKSPAKETTTATKTVTSTAPQTATEDVKNDRNNTNIKDVDDDNRLNFSRLLEQEKEKDNQETPSSTKSSSTAGHDLGDQDELKKALHGSKKKQRITAGCQLQFDTPNSMAGAQLVTAVVKYVAPKEKIFVLHMDSGHMLRREDRVKLVKRMHRGKLVDNEQASFQSVNKYSLVGTKDAEKEAWVGNKQVDAIKDMLQETKEELANAPETAVLAGMVRGSGKKVSQRPSDHKDSNSSSWTPSEGASVGENSTKTPTSENMAKAQPSTVKGSKPTSEKGLNFVCNIVADDWWKKSSEEEIQVLGEKAEAACKQRRGKAEHMSASQLRLAIRVRRRLQQLAEEKYSNGEFLLDDYLDNLRDKWDLESDFECSDRALQNFLSGDPQKLTRLAVIDKIEQHLKAWLEEVGEPVEIIDYNDEEDDKSTTKKAANPTTNRRSNASKKKAPTKKASEPAKKVRSETHKREKNVKIMPTNENSPIYPNAAAKRGSSGKKRPASSHLAMLVYAPESKRRHSIISEPWWHEGSVKDLHAQMKVAEEAVKEPGKRSRGKAPHMSAEQLNVAIQVRLKMEEMANKSDGEQSLGEILSDLVDSWNGDVGTVGMISENQVKKFLSGDHRALVSSAVLREIARRFKIWLGNVSMGDDEEEEAEVIDENAGDNEVVEEVQAQSTGVQKVSDNGSHHIAAEGAILAENLFLSSSSKKEVDRGDGKAAKPGSSENEKENSEQIEATDEASDVIMTDTNYANRPPKQVVSDDLSDQKKQKLDSSTDSGLSASTLQPRSDLASSTLLA